MTTVVPAFRVVALAFLALIAGCASQRSSAAFVPMQAEAGKGVLYIFRPASGRSFHVDTYINSVPAGELDKGQYRAIVLDPGEYLVRAESRSSMVRSVVIIPGGASYLMVKVERRGKCIIEAPEPELARRLIAGMRRAPDDEPAKTASR